jgi:hypothetical protein
MAQFQKHHCGRFLDLRNREEEYIKIVGHKPIGPETVGHLIHSVGDRAREMHATGRDVELVGDVISDVVFERFPPLGIAIKVAAAFFHRRERISLGLNTIDQKPIDDTSVTTLHPTNTGLVKPRHLSRQRRAQQKSHAT